jgi:WD40 repeat protein
VIETRRFPLTSSEVFSNLRAPGLCAYYATNGDLYLLDADASEPVTRHALGLRQPQLLAVTPDGLYLLALEDARAQTPGRLGVWNVPLNRLERELDRGKLYVGGSLSADGRLALAFTGDSSDVLVWTVGRREPLSVLHNSSWFLSRSSFSPDGKQAAVASFDGTVRVWDAASARQALPVLKGHRSGVTSVQFANDGRTLLTCDSVVLHFWNLKTGQEMLLLEGLNEPVLSRHNGSLGWWDISDTTPAGQMRWRATSLPTLAEIDAIERQRDLRRPQPGSF